MNTMLRTAVAASLALGATASAHAVQVFGLDGAGGSTLLSTTWSIYGGSPAGGTTLIDINNDGTDWEVNVGVPNFGAAESDSQTSGIYGAGTRVSGYSGYRVVFDFDGFTWDSYNDTVPVNPGASDGYWDLFAVSLNPTDFYWNLVNGGAGAAGDPLIGPDPAGNPVIDPTGLGGGVLWGWGGLDYSAGFFEEEHGTYSLTMLGTPTQEFFISAVLDTRTTPNADSGFPSWGCFNDHDDDCPDPTGGQSQDVPEPGTMLLLGLGMLGLGAVRRRSA